MKLLRHEVLLIAVWVLLAAWQWHEYGRERDLIRESLVNHADWSFAGGDFLLNPAVHEGDMERIFASARLGGRYNFLRAEYESAEDLIDRLKRIRAGKKAATEGGQ